LPVGDPGQEGDMTESTGRTPHSEEPAEGQPASDDVSETGRTPHAGQPAEGAEAAAADGVDPDSRITGA
jgi:hypothetical protein